MTGNNNKKQEPGGLKGEPFVVIMVPFPAQGHLNQLLQLSCIISSYGLPVHYVGSTIHNRQAKLRATSFDPSELTKIHFRDLQIPDFPSPSPDPNAATKFPMHLQPSWDATFALRQPVADILQNISSTTTRIVVIYDPLMTAVVQDASSIPNAEAYTFPCVSAFTLLFMRWEFLGKPVLTDPPPKGLPNLEDCLTKEALNLVASLGNLPKFHVGEIHNTCRVLDGTYLDLLAHEELGGKEKQWAIGPLLPARISLAHSSNSQRNCLEWLDKQPQNSVVYVSFGTTTSMSDAEVKELATGLEQSKQKFIWVLRDADKGDVFDREVRRIASAERIEERFDGQGIIIRDWAPQPEILAHPATCVFVSHCGWNSCLESIYAGVPIAAWPMHSDQPWNTLLITEILKIGLVVREWTRREDLVRSSDIANTLKLLMASPEGDEIRKRAEELGGYVRRSTEEGGTSRVDLVSFIAHITRYSSS